MRKRKLYLSELLKRSQEEKLCVHLSSTKGTMNYWYDDILTCLQEIRYSYLWNLQVNSWLVTEYGYTNRKRDKLLVIQLIEVE